MWLNQLGINALLPSPGLVQGCSASCGALPTGRPVAPNWGHRGGVDGQLRSPEQREAIDDDFQPAVVHLTEKKKIHVLSPHVDCDLSPASWQTRASALSNAKPRRPNTLPTNTLRGGGNESRVDGRTGR